MWSSAPQSAMEYSKRIETAKELIAAVVRAGGTRHVVAATAAALQHAVHSYPDSLDTDSSEAYLDNRKADIGRAVEAHAALNEINGEQQHNLGQATKVASSAGNIDKLERAVLQRLRKRANRARHVWPKPMSEQEATSSPQGDGEIYREDAATQTHKRHDRTDLATREQGAQTAASEQASAPIAWYPVLVPRTLVQGMHADSEADPELAEGVGSEPCASRSDPAGKDGGDTDPLVTGRAQVRNNAADIGGPASEGQAGGPEFAEGVRSESCARRPDPAEEDEGYADTSAAGRAEVRHNPARRGEPDGPPRARGEAATTTDANAEQGEQVATGRSAPPSAEDRPTPEYFYVGDVEMNEWGVPKKARADLLCFL